MSVDHRRLGRELEFFATASIVGAGLPLWLPDGAAIRCELEKLAAEEAARSGCSGVYSPVLAKKSLFELSGHWDKFADEMFPPMKVGGEELVLRPANCPHHAQIFAAKDRSYRDLPIRLSELGAMFRSELSGVLGGLSRVRQINLDDAHVFCSPEQVSGEVHRALDSIDRVYACLGISGHIYRLSIRARSGSFFGDDAGWKDAELQLGDVLRERGIEYLEAVGDAAFYGPKIDVQVDDSRGRELTLSTVQLDFNQPERFGLDYVASDGVRRRPVMIHRGVLGSMERTVALLIERYQGRLPPWLSPRQVAVLPIASRHEGSAADLTASLRERGLRSDSIVSGSLSSRIHDSRMHRDPYIAVVGDTEVREQTVAVTVPTHCERSVVGRSAFVDAVANNVAQRAVAPALF